MMWSGFVKNYKEERPWGSFENLLDEDYCKVKRIIVKPGQRLSYQYHHERTEHWVVVQGEAIVTLDDEEYEYHIGDVVEIDETIIEIATDKVDSEVPSTHEGKLLE